jgi:peptide/nickel transport system ATP-binding protein
MFWIPGQVQEPEKMDEQLCIKGLKVTYGWEERTVNALVDIDLSLKKGECAGIVGESGCGKSTLAYALMGLIDPMEGRIEAGSVDFELTEGNCVDMVSLDENAMRHIRGMEVSLIMQDPYNALNPVMRIGEQMQEAYLVHNKINEHNEEDVVDIIRSKLRDVSLPDDQTILGAYPHQLSGGMLQRVGIAIALLNDPCLLIADEPTSNLDVTIQKKIVENIAYIRDKSELTMIFITHNLNLVAKLADKLYILYAGRIVEYGPCKDIFINPAHPYTKGLIDALPRILEPGKKIKPIPGTVPAGGSIGSGCDFAPRCSISDSRCSLQVPVKEVSDGHFARCLKLL